MALCDTYIDIPIWFTLITFEVIIFHSTMLSINQGIDEMCLGYCQNNPLIDLLFVVRIRQALNSRKRQWT